MLETHTRIIDEKQFKVTELSYWDARELEAKILDLIAPLLADVAGSFQGAGDIDNISLDTLSFDGASLSKAINKLLVKVPYKQRKALIKEILAKTICDIVDEEGTTTSVDLLTDDNFDVVFGTSVLLTYKVAAFVAEVNFPDYFGRAQGIGSKIAKTLSSKLGMESIKKE